MYAANLFLARVSFRFYSRHTFPSLADLAPGGNTAPVVPNPPAAEPEKLPLVFLDVKVGDAEPKRMVFRLRQDVAPKVRSGCARVVESPSCGPLALCRLISLGRLLCSPRT